MTSQPALSPDLLRSFVGSGRVWVAYSGGLDSTVLLHLAVAAGLAQQGRLQAVHVHHGLQSGADDWARHCADLCRQWSVPCRVERVTVDPEYGLEAGARDARYRVFESLLQPDDVLLLAQHADDQSETLLLRLLRGAGVRGLSAMASTRRLGAGRLVRPLLVYSRRDLERYAREHALVWIDDDSNDDNRFDRNYLRQQVMPLLRQRWPALNPVLARAARLQREASELLNEYADQDLAMLLNEGAIELEPLLRLSRRRQQHLIRRWLLTRGVEVPELRQLEALLRALEESAADRHPRLSWGGWVLERYEGRLWLRTHCAVEQAGWSPQHWDLGTPLVLPGGSLVAEPVVGAGLRFPAGSCVTVSPRQGGERLRLEGRAGSRSLKKLLQEAKVPPWQRSQLPLIYVDGELAAVADRWICAAFEAQPGEPGWRIHWRCR